jgi:hypothetical protein
LDDHKDSKSSIEKGNLKPKLPRVKINETDVIRDGDKKTKYDTTPLIPTDPPTETPTTERVTTTTERVTTSTTEKVKTTTQEVPSTTTQKVPSTTTPRSTTSKSPKTTTSSVPIDPSTPVAPVITTIKPDNVVPDNDNTHPVRWFFGKFYYLFLAFKQKINYKKYYFLYDIQVFCLW